jgi:6-phospho-3-hexuloisomerase
MKSNTAGNVPSVDLPSWAAHACHELQAIVGAIAVEDIDALSGLLAQAGVIAVHGLGREGLMMRAFSMRLFHLGLRATPVGDMALPAVGVGDLLLASAGPGHFDTVAALMRIARAAGTKTVLFTAEPDAPLRSCADLTILLPARTMARPAEHSSGPPALPMGSTYEGGLFLLCEYIVAQLASRLEIDEVSMRARHTNLE